MDRCDYGFSVTQLVAQEVDPLDLSIFTCVKAGCHIIIIVCEPQQIPYFKTRYGEGVLNYDLEARTQITPKDKFHKARPVGIYYISPSLKYKNAQTDVFSTVEVAHLFRDAMDLTFEVLSPTHFFLCLPYIIVSPDLLFLHEKMIAYLGRKTTFRDVICGWKVYHGPDEFADFDDCSHLFIPGSLMEEAWSTLRGLWRQHKRNEIPLADVTGKTFKDLFGDYQSRITDYFAPSSERYFNILRWKRNIGLINHLNDFATTEVMQWKKYSIKTNLKFLPKLTDGYVQDDTYFQDKIGKTKDYTKFNAALKKRRNDKNS